MWHIIRYELTGMLRDPAYWLAAVLLMLATSFAAVSGARYIQSRQAYIAGLQQQTAEFYEQLRAELDSVERGQKTPPGMWEDPRNPILAGLSIYRGGGYYAVLPPRPLAAVAIGQLDIYPDFSKVNAQAADLGYTNESLENPFHLLTGKFDLAFVYVFLSPLLIIAFAFRMLSGEREQGTLALVYSQPVQPVAWLSLRAAGRMLLLTATMLAALLPAAWLADLLVFSPDGLRLAGAIALYNTCWFTLALLVNQLKLSSSANVLLLLAAWVLFVMMIPGFAHLTASALYPVPSRAEWVNSRRAAELRAERERDSILTAYYQTQTRFQPLPESEQRDEQAWVEYWVLKMASDQYIQQVNIAYQTQLDRQQAAARQFRWLSPAVLMQEALNRIAGTDTERLLRFRRQLEPYQAEWQALLAPKLLEGSPMTQADYERLPVFRFVEE